jgi:hypothetical protein
MSGSVYKHLRIRQHATPLFMESWNPFLWNPGIIEIGFHNHPPDRRGSTLKFSNWKIEKLKHRRARLPPPNLHIVLPRISHKIGIVHLSTQFGQATIGFSSSLSTKPYKNNVVLISIVFISSLRRFWSVFSSFWTLPGRHRADPSTAEDVSRRVAGSSILSGYLVHLQRWPLLTST